MTIEVNYKKMSTKQSIKTLNETTYNVVTIMEMLAEEFALQSDGYSLGESRTEEIDFSQGNILQ